MSSRDLLRRECYVCVRRAHAARQYKGWYFVQPVVSMCADADRFQVRLFLKYVLSTFFLFFFSHLYIRECIKYSVVFFVVALQWSVSYELCPLIARLRSIYFWYTYTYYTMKDINLQVFFARHIFATFVYYY